jgi:hypothetical protein
LDQNVQIRTHRKYFDLYVMAKFLSNHFHAALWLYDPDNRMIVLVPVF